MKIAQYNDMMSYLTRPGFKDGDTVVPPPKPLTESQVKNKLDLYIKGFIGGFDKMEMIDLMNEISKKADESGVMSQEDVFNFVQERKDFYQKFLEENKGEGIELPRQKFADGLSVREFGEMQSATTAENFQRQLTPSQEGKALTKVVIQALKEAGIKYVPAKGSGSKATFDNVTEKTIKKFNETVQKLKVEQSLPMKLEEATALKKRIKDFVLDKLKKGEYVSRPIIKKEFNLTQEGANSIITKALGTKRGSGKGATFTGGLLDKLGKEERKEKTRELGKKMGKARLKSSDEIIKALNEEFKFDPDVESGPELTRRIYGDAFDKADAAGKAELINQVDNDIRKYLRALEGGYKPKGLKLPDQETINDIIDRIDKGEFKFSSGSRRALLFDVVDNLLGVPSGTFKNQRRILTKQGFELDEIFGLSNVSRKAPGYAEAFQLISPKANQDKKRIIDLPLSKLLSAIDEGKESVVYKKKKMPLSEAIKNFNKDSLNFSNDYKIKSPKINIGTKFNKSDYKNFSKESLKNIEDVYKNKNYFLSEVKNRPVETFTEKAKEVSKTSSINQIKDMDLKDAGQKGYISTDLLKDVGKFGLKAVGSLPVSLALATDTTKKGLEEGKSFIDAVTQPMVGIDLLYPEVFKKLGPLMAKTARASTPVGVGITGIGILKDRAKNMINQAEAIAATEATPYQQDLIEDFAKQYKGFEYGGRVGYADGPDDPGKRKFMKIMMGGLASLPILSRFFKVGEMVAPVAEKAVDVASGAPPYFFNLVDRIRALGQKVGGPKERSESYVYKDYSMDIDLDTGAIDIKKTREAMIPGGDEAGIAEEVYMTYKPGMADETTEGKKVVDEYEEFTARPDIDGKMKDVEDGVPDEVIEEGSIGKEQLEQEILEEIAREKNR